MHCGNAIFVCALNFAQDMFLFYAFWPECAFLGFQEQIR